MKIFLAEKKTVESEMTDWVDRFEIQDMAKKKSMLINLIDRITVYDDKITVKYKYKCNYLNGGLKYDPDKEMRFGEIPDGMFPLPNDVQSMSQPSRERSYLSVPRRKIRMRA